MTVIEKILDYYEDDEFLKADGFDNAVIGVDAYNMILVYSIEKCVKILRKEGMSEVDAIEHLSYNVLGS
jgi:hypothetical protein